MVRISNSLVGFLNFLTLLISFPIIGAGLWFRLHAATECERFLQLPLLVLGGFLLVVSVLGLIGACCCVSFFMVTNKGVGEAVSGVGFKEYRLSDYSGWLQKRVENWETWRQIDGCLKDAQVCAGLEGLAGLQDSQFLAKNLSPLQSGCCKPPTFCGFQYKNATFWTVPTAGLKSTDADCKLWSNDQGKLCYDCGSCKAGVLATLKSKWKVVSIFNIALLVLLIIVYSIGCCALRNNRAKMHGGYYPYAR
ncbi:Tetraspanin family [Musa troglodytarum]|uniref:Tetraspanin family n=1 Tax=Musa troglodytarum TaxID=320322 RepID=A0A9E7H150_9LILI|nr:Tetraspanin family [Musa troglodytarum]